MKLLIKCLSLTCFVFTLGHAREEVNLIIKDMGLNQIVKQEGDIFLRKSPCCSFNIALSLMGFDTGILENETVPLWPYEEKYQASMDIHKGAHNPTTWMQHSCVWYSQITTQKIGREKFQNYVDLFDYGNKDISGDIGKNNGLSNSWRCSSLQISPLEQISFVEKLVRNNLPVSSHALEQTKKILFVTTLPNDWKLFGKTGTGFQVEGLQFGWFVGWAMKENKVLLIALLLQDSKKEQKPAGPRAKEAVKKILTFWKD